MDTKKMLLYSVMLIGSINYASQKPSLDQKEPVVFSNAKTMRYNWFSHMVLSNRYCPDFADTKIFECTDRKDKVKYIGKSENFRYNQILEPYPPTENYIKNKNARQKLLNISDNIRKIVNSGDAVYCPRCVLNGEEISSFLVLRTQDPQICQHLAQPVGSKQLHPTVANALQSFGFSPKTQE